MKAWDQGFGTGVQAMDSEHRLQAGLVSALEAALQRGEDSPAAQAMGQLIELTAAHFHAEELLMRLHAYPAADAHSLEHRRLLEELRRIEGSALGEDRAEALAAVGALRPWLAEHVRSLDRGLGLWCLKRRTEDDPAGQ
jgi:hemerythrin-like metal-binding protein